MRKILITASFLLLNLVSCFSQEQQFNIPDYDMIKSNIAENTSKFFYAKLLDRMHSNDASLEIDDYRYLYYGYLFNSKYDPFYISSDEDKLKKYYQSEKINEKDYDKIIQLGEHSISEFPFDLRQMNFLAYIYHLKGDEVSAKKISDRFHKIVKAIMSTGDGKNCNSAFHVISVIHEYVLLNLFELQSISQSLIENCDYIEFEKGKYKIDGMYFSVGKMLENKMPFLKAK